MLSVFQDVVKLDFVLRAAGYAEIIALEYSANRDS